MRAYAFVVLLSAGLVISGCDQFGNSSSEKKPAPAPVPSDPVIVNPVEQQAMLKHRASRPLVVATNVYGASISLVNAETEEVIETQQLKAGELDCKFEKKPVEDYHVRVEAGSFSRTLENAKANSSPVADPVVQVNLSAIDYRELVKSATCLIQDPDGSFGSGFLFGDRQTIATAAHCVAVENIADLTFTFYPEESNEETVSGAELIFFDNKQDVAVLRLPEPVGTSHVWLWKNATPTMGQELLIMGNPGRDGKYDPMYARLAKVATMRPDELQVDIELYPGYSGGPVCVDESLDVVGVVSYKIAESARFEVKGRSYARSASIVADAYRQWDSLSEDQHENYINRIADRYKGQFSDTRAFQVSYALLTDSAVYTMICMSVLQDYMQYLIKEQAKLPRGLSVGRQRILLKKVHKTYLEEEAPKIAEKVRERVSPKLIARNLQEDFEATLADNNIQQSAKDHLQSAYDNYKQLKEAAETIVSDDKKDEEDRSAEEFQEWILELFGDARYHAKEVMEQTGGR